MPTPRLSAASIRGWRHRPLLLAVLLLIAAALPVGIVHTETSHSGPPATHQKNSGASVAQDGRLILTPDQWAKDQQGPTMDEMFPPDGIGMRLPILAWWLVVELLGLIAFPFCFLFLAGLADRGFVIAKTMGLLLVGYLAWIGTSLGVVSFDVGALWLFVGLLAIASVGTAIVLRQRLVEFFHERWRGLVAGELVFLAGFAIFLGLRLWYPDLGHQFSPVSPSNFGEGRMGEKQMELAFLNAVVRSRVFPPLDPFFAHGYINYYYYGYVLVGVLCKLSQIIPSTGFNLAIATFFAMLLGNTYSVVYALVRRITPGVIAAILVGLIGNLNGAWQVVRGLMQMAMVHSSFPVFGGMLDTLSGLQQLIIARQPLPQAFDFWESTRIVPPAGTPISEFPYFTYLFADLHPHLIAFPMTVAAIGLAVSLALQRRTGITMTALTVLLGAVLLGAIAVTNPWDFPTYTAVVAIGALVGGYVVYRRLTVRVLLRPVLWTTGISILGFLLYLPFQRSYRTVFSTGVGLVRDISPESLRDLCTNNPAPCGSVVHDALATPLTIFLEHFGLFLFLILSYLVVLLGRDAGGLARGRRWLMRGQFALYYRDRLPRVLEAARVARHLVHRRQRPVVDGSLLAGLVILTGGLLLFQYVLLAFLVAMLGLAGLLLLRLGRALTAQELFLFGLIALPLALCAVTQIVYVKDFLDGGSAFRMNTIFKFYNQAWVLFAIAGTVALYQMFARLTPEPAEQTPAEEPDPAPAPAPQPVLVAVGGDASPLQLAPMVDETPSPRPSARTLQPRRLPPGLQRVGTFLNQHSVWSSALAVLIASSLIYTYAGTVARETYRTTWLPENSVPFTLDGMAFMKVAYPGDYAAITWLNSHVRGAPVIAETYTPRTYTWPSRVSMFTGLPDIINGNHENVEQRFGDEIDPSSLCGTAPNPSLCVIRTHSRPADLATLYNSTSTGEAWRVIKTYGVRYIYVGFSERQSYSQGGLAKFNAMIGHGLRVAFRSGDTTIYQVTRHA